ncbi:MAG TPA: hypothetical protein VLJ83_02115, partial [Gemmatimonadaceae bacterium]|nr:hypothetical protein [Gemmatimonadaceae bacterium]
FFRIARADVRVLILIASVGVCVACARQTIRPGDDEPVGPIVQVRQFPHAATVSVVAWDPEETAYGLSAQMRQDGSLIEDHRLYVSTYYDGVRLTRAPSLPNRVGTVETVVPAKHVLLYAGASRDPYHCYWGPDCSPYEALEVRVPDEMLRSNRDSVAVRFYGRADNEMIITLHRPLIDAYLAAVDSVATALRSR